QGNAALLAKVPGIGKKTSERLIIELKDKFTNISSSGASLPPGMQGNSVIGDAISALINLGYHPLDAQKAIKKVISLHEKEPSLSELISGALRSI
ncbi:MAG TPA: helix-hairpin-helix domain-containing protein, partial [Rhabdochlamydiaceae bacterium]